MRFLLTRRWRQISCACMAAFLLAGSATGLVGCSRQISGESQDVLTQKTLSGDKTTITVLVKYAFSINAFEKAVEEKFPNIDLVQVGNYTRDMGVAEYEARLEHDDLTDIVMTWPLDVGEKYWSDRLLDLSGMDFTNRYNISILNDISRDGKLYYLPGPSQVRGIVYNKTLFAEKGWQVPKDFDGFVELCQTIEKDGMRSLQLGLGNGEVLDTAFVGYSYADCYSKPQDKQWIDEYNEGKNSFGDHFGSAFDTFQTLIDTGILQKNDLNLNYSDRERMLFTRECAMVEDSVLMARMGYAQTGCTDEFGLMPFFNPDNGNDWARLYMVCYVGLNKHLAEPQNQDKYDLVMQLMDYISSSEGQTAMMGDTGAMFSSLTGMSPPDVPEIADMLPALEGGRYGAFPQLKNAQGALREGLAGMVRGDTTKADVIKMVDAQNSSPPKKTAAQVLGRATADFSLTETGNFVADMMREASGCELALFMDNGKDGKYNGKGISARLYTGDVTTIDIGRVLPDLKSGDVGMLWKITMTGEDLLKTLESSIKVENDSGGWFYYFSGLRMEFAPAAEPGSRIRRITLADGSAVDPQKVYSVAIMNDMVPETYMKSCEKTDSTITSIMEKAVQAKESISPSGDGRFVLAQP